MLTPDRLRLGIVGCGRIVEQLHLPAIALVPQIELAALADIDLERARTLAARGGAPLAVSDYAALYGRVDAVLVATPHALHAPVAGDFLRRGIHVLCEKPLATSVAEAQGMLEAARQGGATLAIGVMRRFYDNTRFVQQAVASARFGPAERFTAEESVPFEQITAPAYYVDRHTPGAGVLWDTGAHTLDLLLWWFGEVGAVQYWDDNRGGVAANCRLELTFASGVQGTVELSRMRRLKNRIQVQFRDADLEILTLEQRQLSLWDRILDWRVRLEPTPRTPLLSEDPWIASFASQWGDFATAILAGRPPAIPGCQGLGVLQLIERCLEIREPLPAWEWESFSAEVSPVCAPC